MPSPALPVGSVPRRGFTLVEIMVAIALIGMLAALAIPAFQRTQRASRNARVLNDIRVFSEAFEIYNTQNGGWPDGAAPGVVPTLPITLADNLRATSWQGQTGFGGQWQWDNALASAGDAGICIIGFNCDDNQLSELDTKIDDGNLGTGRFQKTSPTRVIYVIASGS
ncbi:Type II secretion system protein G precursor [Lacunisphaera limnophila]|uniref:Type II secretion system protein G n=1 Tax=Lacunisphaera limnophila TaxID=1838286 RepID=A0A1D8ASB3_9BACT|nr:type II secretion system protein [Lacunisphaera limnophila]AOS43787.1 Type II secretion system protein G precursor [Lacunisphaera limnophila]